MQIIKTKNDFSELWANFSALNYTRSYALLFVFFQASRVSETCCGIFGRA